MSWSVGGLEAGDHREVTHVGGQQIGVEQARGGGDQVVGGVDAAMGAAVALCEQAGGSRHLLPHRHPGECGEELLQRLDLLGAGTGEELEAHDLAGEKGLVGRDQAAQKVDRGLDAAQVVDRDTGVQQLRRDGRSAVHAKPRQALLEIAAAEGTDVLGAGDAPASPGAGTGPEGAKPLVLALLAEGRTNGTADQLRAGCAGVSRGALKKHQLILT